MKERERRDEKKKVEEAWVNLVNKASSIGSSQQKERWLEVRRFTQWPLTVPMAVRTCDLLRVGGEK